MGLESNLSNQILIMICVVFGAMALTLACVGIGTPNWQTRYLNTTTGEMRLVSTANFFYACRLNLAGEVLGCGERSSNSNIILYYNINATGDQSDWHLHLNIAASFSIMGIICIFFGTIAAVYMFIADREQWVYIVAPVFYFLACMCMLTALAEGSRVLHFNGYSANLYETAHLLTIFSLVVSAMIGGRLFSPPLEARQSRKNKRGK